MPQGKCCATCEFWKKDESLSGWKLETEHGQCSFAKHMDTDGGCDPETIKLPMLTQDGEDYASYLYTLPTHGCNEWKEKPNETEP